MSTQLISRVSSEQSSVESSSSDRSLSAIASDDPRIKKLMKSYQADQQVKYLHLQAEIDVLLQELQTLKQQRLRATVSKTGEK
ncbi:MAG: hypothetical protein AB4426_12810 [Xenococcaceae cyanobacterium]